MRADVVFDRSAQKKKKKKKKKKASLEVYLVLQGDVLFFSCGLELA